MKSGTEQTCQTGFRHEDQTWEGENLHNDEEEQCEQQKREGGYKPEEEVADVDKMINVNFSTFTAIIKYYSY